MAAESKVPGFEPGEYTRDLTDPRYAAVLSRVAGETDAHYIQRLAAAGLAVVLERDVLTAGGYPEAKAKALKSGVPLLVPYDEFERPMHRAFGDANVAEDGTEAKPFDMVEYRRQWQAEEARKKIARDATGTTPV